VWVSDTGARRGKLRARAVVRRTHRRKGEGSMRSVWGGGERAETEFLPSARWQSKRSSVESLNKGGDRQWPRRTPAAKRGRFDEEESRTNRLAAAREKKGLWGETGLRISKFTFADEKHLS